MKRIARTLRFAVLLLPLSLGVVGCSGDQLGMASNITRTALTGGGQIATGILNSIGTPGTALASQITGTAVAGVTQLSTGILGNIAAGQTPGAGLMGAGEASALPVLPQGDAGQFVQ